MKTKSPLGLIRRCAEVTAELRLETLKLIAATVSSELSKIVAVPDAVEFVAAASGLTLAT